MGKGGVMGLFRYGERWCDYGAVRIWGKVV